MADQVFNIAKGRVAQYIDRVRANDPTEASLVIVALKATGIEADDTLRGYDDLAALLAAANDEATNTGYARKVLTDTEMSSFAPAVDDTNDWLTGDIPDQTWTGVAAAGGAWAKLLVCYRPTNASADSAVIPLTHHDFAVTPDGSDITAQIATAGFYKAS